MAPPSNIGITLEQVALAIACLSTLFLVLVSFIWGKIDSKKVGETRHLAAYGYTAICVLTLIAVASEVFITASLARDRVGSNDYLILGLLFILMNGLISFAAGVLGGTSV